MLETQFKWLAPPVFADEEKSRIAATLNIILWATVLLVGILLSFNLIGGDGTIGNTELTSAILILLAIALQVVMRRGFVTAANFSLVSLSWLVITFQAWNADGIRDTAFIAYFLIILLANLLLGWKIGVGFSILSVGSSWAMAYGELTGIIVPDADAAVNVAFDMTIIFSFATVILALTTAGLRNALQQARSNEQALEKSNQELQAIQTSMAEQIVARTQGLEIVARVSERLGAVLDPDQLLDELVHQVRDSFAFYHVHVYLLDGEQGRLLIAAGVGEAGAQMKAQGHAIALKARTSLVAQAARTGEIVWVDNVREAENWLPNPLLPDTYSEMAVPIRAEGHVLGVLDVQEDKIAGFDESDVSMFRSLANQVSIAIQNARLFAESQAALAEAQALQRRYIEEAWDRNRVARRGRGRVQFSLGESSTLTEADIEQARHAAFAMPEPQVILLGEEDAAKESPLVPASKSSQDNDMGLGKQAFVAPIKLQGVSIGNLQLHEGSQPKKWSESELALIETILDQVAQTAETLRLVEDVQERASREQLINQISAKLRRAPDLESLIELGTTELARVLNPSRTFVKLGTEEPAPAQGEPTLPVNGHGGSMEQHLLATSEPSIEEPSNE